MNRILGIDFSGARDAGRKIWIAEGFVAKSRGFKLERLLPASALSDSGLEPRKAANALVRHIASQGLARIGCDFPFSLPRDLLDANDWGRFALDYEARFPSPERFREILMRRTAGKEFKRQTDRIARTPFNSYNLRLYRQTWWGIACVLSPLIAGRAAVVRPQQSARRKRPQVLEVCAACTLKSINLYPSYKGRDPGATSARRLILEGLIDGKYLEAPNPVLRAILIKNSGGDALDALIGAIAAARADLDAEPDEFERLEGRVYFEV